MPKSKIKYDVIAEEYLSDGVYGPVTLGSKLSKAKAWQIAEEEGGWGQYLRIEVIPHDENEEDDEVVSDV